MADTTPAEGTGTDDKADTATATVTAPEGATVTDDQGDALAAAVKRAEDAEREAARLRRSNAAQKPADLDALRAEVRQEFADQLVRAEVRAVAAGMLRDPADALALLDLSALAGPTGAVDSKAVTAALRKLVQEKPYLAATVAPSQQDSSATGPWGDVGAGPRSTAEPEPSNPLERLRSVQRKRK
ncbi:hypothetical protein [Streptomyces sp. NBC_00102]|uniref:hypothetical protein n=1 Tax=Streptomyces sp. NBC_00102 TaxID=2975652 RepID=UPI0022550AC7|nr:hypothetical protein [Streptomyces sp. NBC_00102]MCX5398462.1 hypothetical protein [Streptomyces sp. NBC_00102]